jgi:hypothetical protein
MPPVGSAAVDQSAAMLRSVAEDWLPSRKLDAKLHELDMRNNDEKSDEAQLLPPLRNGETAQLHDPKIEDKETRPPPRYNEGTLIEAMQNAWRKSHRGSSFPRRRRPTRLPCPLG